MQRLFILILAVALPLSAAEVRVDGAYRLRLNADTNLRRERWADRAGE